MKIIMPVLVAALVGCATASTVVPYGSGSYIVNAEDIWGTATSGALKVRAAEEANAYCDKQGKRMQVMTADGKGNIWTGATSSLVFSCT